MIDSLHLIYAITLFITGLGVGSFLNVVVYRVPLGLSLLSPPSFCPRCGHPLAARDNVPLLGWLLLRGKCRYCRAPISWRYPAVELATGLLWAMEGWRLAGLRGGHYTDVCLGLLELVFLSSLVVTVLVDWDHRIILDEISLGGMFAALLASPLLPVLHHAESVGSFSIASPELAALFGDWPAWGRSAGAASVGAIAGLGFSLLIYWFGNAAFRKQIEAAKAEDPEIDSALGLGDVKLMGFYGAWLGWRAVPLIFFIASLTGAGIGGVMKIRSGNPGGRRGLAGLANRWRTGHSVVPFGPFLALGAAVVFAFETSIGHWLGWLPD